MRRRLLYSASILAMVSAWRADATLLAARKRTNDLYFGSLGR